MFVPAYSAVSSLLISSGYRPLAQACDPDRKAWLMYRIYRMRASGVLD